MNWYTESWMIYLTERRPVFFEVDENTITSKYGTFMQPNTILWGSTKHLAGYVTRDVAVFCGGTYWICKLKQERETGSLIASSSEIPQFYRAGM